MSLGIPISYHRLNKIPLDDSEVFTSLRNLMNYCDSGACYDGQRVIVIDNEHGNNIMTQYIIKNNIPIIDMNGFEPVFKEIEFTQGNTTHGLLIYSNIDAKSEWTKKDVFSLDYNKLSLFNQIEIFRKKDNNSLSYNFCLEYVSSDRSIYNDSYESEKWTQQYNPYYYNGGDIEPNNSDTIQEMAFIENENSYISINIKDYIIMPKNGDADIINIYVEAEDYYNAIK